MRRILEAYKNMDQQQQPQPVQVLAAPLQGTGSGLATHDGVQRTTDAQTSWMTMMGWVRFAATAVVIVLSAFGVGVTVNKVPPTPAPDAVQQLIELWKAQQAAKPAAPIVIQPAAPAVAPVAQPEWNADNVRKWLEAESNKLKETKK